MKNEVEEVLKAVINSEMWVMIYLKLNSITSVKKSLLNYFNAFFSLSNNFVPVTEAHIVQNKPKKNSIKVCQKS